MKKTLVVYFSASGVTARAAKEVAAAVGADLYEIRPEQPYTASDLDWMDKRSRSTLEMNDPACRPAIAEPVEQMEQYDTVFVGFPVWWYVEPRIVDTFLESYDFTGKTLIPFNTSASGGFGRSLSGIEESAAGAEILEGFTVTSDQVEGAQEDVSAWISGLGLESGGAE